MKRVRPRFVFVVLFALLCWTHELPAVQVGATRAQVITELGKPLAHAMRDDREILVYPKGVQIQLLDGKVESGRGIVLTVEDPKPAGEVEATPAPSAAKPGPAATASPTAVPTPPAASKTPGAATVAPSPATSRPATSPTVAAKPAPLPPIDHSMIIAAIMLIAHFAATLIGLRIGFRYWHMDASLPVTVAIAGIDFLTHTLLLGLGPMTSGTTAYPPVQSALAGVLMIITTRLFCPSKPLRDIVQIAYLVQFVAMLLRMFAYPPLLDRFF